MKPPKPLQLPGTVPGSNPARGTAPPPLSLGGAGQPTATPKPANAPSEAPRGLSSAPRALALRGTPPNPLEPLVQAAVEANPALAPVRHRLVPRMQRLQGAQEKQLLCWGEENLETSVANSRVLAEVATKLAALQVEHWIQQCNKHSTGQSLGFFAELFGQKPTPQLYEAKLREIQAALAPLILVAGNVQQQAQNEVEDLSLDTAALQQVAGRYSDAGLQMVVQNRLRILTGGMQAAAQLGIQAERTKLTLLQNCQVIDQLLSVALPAWRLRQAGAP